MLRTLESSGVDLKCGLVEYRDHPPEDGSYVTRVHKFGKSTLGDSGQVAKKISSLLAEGGGDAPEAVYDGVFHAAKFIDWRPSCRFRIAVLVGDAPPQGNMMHPEEGDCAKYAAHWRDRTPSGIGLHECTSAAEEAMVEVYSVAVGNGPEVVSEFKKISNFTGGSHFKFENGKGVRSLIMSVKKESADLRAVHAAVGDNPPWDLDVDELSARLGFPLSKTCKLLSILRS